MSVISKGLNDKLGFGKYADSTVKDVIDSDPAYIAWLRDAKRDNKFFFQRSVHILINMAISRSKYLKSRFKVWTEEQMPDDSLPSVASAETTIRAEKAADGYGIWGAF